MKRITHMRATPRYVVCPKCEGVGRVDNPAFSNGFTGDDYVQDPDFFEDYMAGHYDVACPLCLGNKVTTRKEINKFNKTRDEAREDWESEGKFLAGSAFGLQGIIDNRPD